MTKGLQIVRIWKQEDGTESRLAELINEAIQEEREACAKIADGCNKTFSCLGVSEQIRARDKR